MTTRTRPTPFTLIVLAGMAGMTAITTTAWGQNGDRSPEHVGPERPALAGPRVREHRMPGMASGFSASAGLGSRMGEPVVPARVFREVLQGLMAEDAPQVIRLSSEQRERITGHVRAFERDTRDARSDQARSHDPAARPVDRRVGHADDGPGRARPREDRGPDAMRPDMGRRGEIARGTRSPGADHRASRSERERLTRSLGALQARVWAELSAAQQAHLGEAIEAWRTRADDEQAERARDRYRREIGARFDSMEGPRRDRPGGEVRERRRESDAEADRLAAVLSRLPKDAQQRLRARLESMSAEQREGVLARLADRRDENSMRRRPD